MHLTPTLTVSLPAIVANWRWLRSNFTGEECAAVVKADAYGLGMVPVAHALAEAGCHTFFVATLSEGVALRAVLADVRILVFHGVQAGEEFAFVAHRLIPVLNSIPQITRWRAVAAEHVHAVSALHIDTGMARMGLEPQEFTALMRAQPNLLADCRVGLLLSHFACAPEAAHPLNAEQLALFQNAAALAPGIPTSLCNSGGIYLGHDVHFNLARPGCALYGIAAQSKDSGFRIEAPQQTSPSRGEVDAVASGGGSLPTSEVTPTRPLGDLPPGGGGLLRQVVQWHAPILMTRTLERLQTVGYGATQTLPGGTRIATVASGYADGYLRSLSGKAVAYVGEHQVPLVGRVTMDMLCFDVTHVPENELAEGMPLTLLGDHEGIRVDDVADAAGTIGYEILTRIGARVKRVYA